MAETVGSIMGIHTGKGRYLTPENFSNELYLGDILHDMLHVTPNVNCLLYCMFSAQVQHVLLHVDCMFNVLIQCP